MQQFEKINGQRFEENLRTGRKDRYELMCVVDAYNKDHIPMLDDASSGGGIPMKSV